MNSSQTVQPQSNPSAVSGTLNSNQAANTLPVTEQLKGLQLQNQVYSSVPNQITGNKENNKKSGDSLGGPKAVLKPREFGREITNATTASSVNGIHSSKHSSSAGDQIVGSQTSLNSENTTTSSVAAIGGQGMANKEATNVARKTSDIGPQGHKVGHTKPIQRNHTNNFGPHKTSLEQQPIKKQKSTLATAKANNTTSTESSHSSQEQLKAKSVEKTSPNLQKSRAEEVREQCKDRIAQYRKTLIKSMVLCDQLDMRDPQSIAEYAQEVYQSMRELEPFYKIDHEYIQKVQKEIKDTSRAFLVEWLIDVHRKFRLMPETLYVTVNIVDRYLSLKEIKKSELHLLGVTSLLISTKYEEIYPPDLKDLLSVSENKFTKAEVLKMENKILSTLEFNFLAPSMLRFLERFRKLSNTASDDQIFFFAQYLCEIALLDASLLKYKTSELAASALILSAKAIKRINAWNKEMEKNTGYKEDDLKEAIEDLKSFAYEVNPKFLSTLKYKFSKTEYFEVANIPFKF